MPATAEVVIEGRILPGVREPEGPFGESTGYYFAFNNPVIEVTALTHRSRPLHQAIVPAGAEGETILSLCSASQICHYLAELVEGFCGFAFLAGTYCFHGVLSLPPSRRRRKAVSPALGRQRPPWPRRKASGTAARQREVVEVRIIVGISGATGPVYGIRLLEVLNALGVETHLIISEAACRNIVLESNYSVEQVKALASYVDDVRDVGTAPASGSFLCAGMAVIPCSIKTLSGIANSYNDNLLVRAADVIVKERRKLVLVVRETPLHAAHLKLMLAATEAGAVILPPMPAFYHRPQTIEDLVDQTVGKVLDQFSIPHGVFARWSGADGFEQDQVVGGGRRLAGLA